MQLSEAKLIQRYREEFDKKLGIKLDLAQFAFINNTYAHLNQMPEDPEAWKAYQENRSHILEFCLTRSSFDCKDLELVENENKLLRDALYKCLEELEAKKAEFEALV